jgi:hypothetical protein
MMPCVNDPAETLPGFGDSHPDKPPMPVVCRKEARLVVIGLIALVANLVASLVSLVVVVFFEVPLPGVVPVMRFVILAITHTDLVVLVFRIILIVSLVL